MTEHVGQVTSLIKLHLLEGSLLFVNKEMLFSFYV
jgi:hypothetical protein